MPNFGLSLHVLGFGLSFRVSDFRWCVAGAVYR